MKRYGLLKDLPPFSKGDVFYLGVLGDLIREKDGVIAYAKPTLEKFNILDSDWFVEIPEGYKRWRAEEGERYWWVQNDGGATNDCDDWVDIDDGRYELGNYFKTEEEAQKASDWLKAFAILRDDTKGFKPDWKNEKQKRWYVFYSLFNGEFYTEGYIDCHSSPIIFAAKDDAQASIKNHEQEWRTFLNCGVEE